MRYSNFQREHLFVGSGVIETGCKTVISSRLNSRACSRRRRHHLSPMLPSQRPVRGLLGGATGRVTPTSTSHGHRTDHFHRTLPKGLRIRANGSDAHSDSGLGGPAKFALTEASPAYRRISSTLTRSSAKIGVSAQIYKRQSNARIRQAQDHSAAAFGPLTLRADCPFAFVNPHRARRIGLDSYDSESRCKKRSGRVCPRVPSPIMPIFSVIK